MTPCGRCCPRLRGRRGRVGEPPYFPDTKLLREDLAGYYGEVKRLDFDLCKYFVKRMPDRKRGTEK